MTDHSRKVSRAIAMSRIGDCRESASAMLRAIPDEVIAALPARLIAQIIDANWRLARVNQAMGQADAINNGCIWDERQQRHRDIAA